MPSTEEAGLYKRFVEIGRVVLISYGPLTGKLATVVDVVDQNRVRYSDARRPTQLPWRIASPPLTHRF
jgi:ribosomal protein L14E/L6E/L27E